MKATNPHDLAWGYWKITTSPPSPPSLKRRFSPMTPFSQFNPNKHIFLSLTLHYYRHQLFATLSIACRQVLHSDWNTHAGSPMRAPPTFQTQPKNYWTWWRWEERGQNDGSKRQSTECYAIIHVMDFILSKYFTPHNNKKRKEKKKV